MPAFSRYRPSPCPTAEFTVKLLPQFRQTRGVEERLFSLRAVRCMNTPEKNSSRRLAAVKNRFLEIGSTGVPYSAPILKWREDLDLEPMNPSIDTRPFLDEPAELQIEARKIATEAMSRLLIWMTDGRTLERRGLRASVALYCVRPDLVECATLDDLGALAGCSKQAVHKHVVSFRRATGFPA